MVSKDGELVAPVLQVVSLVVATTHMETNRQFYIHGIEETYAGKQFFETAAGKISIEQYFREKYKRSLRFPRLPLASERKAANVLNYYPLELLVIEPGQRVSSKKLTGTLTERMIQQARILPHEMKKNNRRQLALARLDGDNNEYLSSFRVRSLKVASVRISSEFVTSEGKVLAAPEITYKTGSLQPDGRGKLSWKLAERLQFYRPATVEAVSIVILDKAVHRNQASDFYHALARMGRSRGMEIRESNVKIHEMYSELNSRIEEHFRLFQAARSKVQGCYPACVRQYGSVLLPKQNEGVDFFFEQLKC
uniref:PAZ domain-containing protein n=1 Tax=Angiostrongylus cantonensis TaxID=6313 RepID=A0A0K0DR87_ANGCA